MKNLTLITVIALTVLTYSCDPCEGTGYGHLEVTNDSYSTTQRIIIDGTSYGTLGPGETELYDLAEGEHYLQFEGISGGCGCTPSIVHILECETESRTCRYK